MFQAVKPGGRQPQWRKQPIQILYSPAADQCDRPAEGRRQTRQNNSQMVAHLNRLGRFRQMQQCTINIQEQCPVGGWKQMFMHPRLAAC
jgi:hypothetical protein